MQLLCSTGAFGRYPVLIDHRDVARYASLLPVAGFELMYYPDWTTQIDEIARDLLATGLHFPALHVEKNAGPAMISLKAEERTQGREELRASCRLGQLLGARAAVFHLWGMPEADTQIERNLAQLSECIDIAQAHELDLAVETVPCLSSTPLEVIRRVIERDDRCRIALDTEFLAIYGQVEEALEADWLWSNKRVCHIHLKDYDGQQYTAEGYRRYLHPGEGQIDFANLFVRLRQRGFTGNLSLEASVVNPDGTRDIERLRHSLEKLNAALAESTN
jgi:sugar phosphate isomerase/epimerase